MHKCRKLVFRLLANHRHRTADMTLPHFSSSRPTLVFGAKTFCFKPRRRYRLVPHGAFSCCLSGRLCWHSHLATAAPYSPKHDRLTAAITRTVAQFAPQSVEYAATGVYAPQAN